MDYEQKAKYYIKKYNKTNNEEYFERLLDLIDFIISREIYRKSSRHIKTYYEDIKNKARLEIWKAIKKYDESKGKAISYILMIVQRTISQQYTDLNYGKRKINQEAISIDKPISDEVGKNKNLLGFVDDNFDLENYIINQFEYKRKDQELRKILSERQLTVYNEIYGKVLNENLIDNAYDDIKNKTGLTHKQIDNAMYLIKKKAKRIS